jgi:hypothetical protein
MYLNGHDKTIDLPWYYASGDEPGQLYDGVRQYRAQDAFAGAGDVAQPRVPLPPRRSSACAHGHAEPISGTVRCRSRWQAHLSCRLPL